MTHVDSGRPNCEEAEKSQTKDDTPTASDALLLRLVDMKLLSYEGLSILTKAIADGSFNSKDVTIRKVEDAVIRPMHEKHLAMSREERAWTTGIPHVVVKGVVDVLSEIIDAEENFSVPHKLLGIIDEAERKSLHDSSEEAMLILKEMSDVHPSWRMMTACVIGRSALIAMREVGSLMQDTSNMYTYGPWTESLRCRSSLRSDQNEPFGHFEDSQLSFCFYMLPTRFPYLRKLTLTFYCFEQAEATAIASMAFPPELEEVAISEDVSPLAIHKIVGILEMVVPRLALCSELRVLHTHYVYDRTRRDEAPPTSVPDLFQSITALPSFEALHLVAPLCVDLLLSQATELVWCRDLGGDIALDAVKSVLDMTLPVTDVQLLDRRAQFREIARSVRVLHFVFSAIWYWDKTDFDFGHCSSLRELVAGVPEEFMPVDEFLQSLPLTLSSLTLMFRSSSNKSVIDEALRHHISLNTDSNLTKLRISVLYEHDPPGSAGIPISQFLEQTDPLSIFPFTFAACKSRGISFMVWTTP